MNERLTEKDEDLIYWILDQGLLIARGASLDSVITNVKQTFQKYKQDPLYWNVE